MEKDKLQNVLILHSNQIMISQARLPFQGRYKQYIRYTSQDFDTCVAPC